MIRKDGQPMLKGKTVVLAVSGSIAAYKIASLASALGKLHADVQVLMTRLPDNLILPGICYHWNTNFGSLLA